MTLETALAVHLGNRRGGGGLGAVEIEGQPSCDRLRMCASEDLYSNAEAAQLPELIREKGCAPP